MGMFSKRPDPSKQTRTSHLLGLVIAISAVGLVVLLQAFAQSLDHQIVNMASAGLLLFASVTFVVWWYRNVSSLILKWGVLFTAFAVVVYGLTAYEFIGFSGELVPQFRSRFADRTVLPILEGSGSYPLNSTDAQIVIEPNDYPRFLGSNASGKLGTREFKKDWTVDKPRMIWRHPLGKGLSGIATATLRSANASRKLAYTIEQREQDEVVCCYEVEGGTLVWFHAEKAFHYDPLGDTGPRSTPTISDDGLVYAQGATGNFWCLDAITGKLVWKADLLSLAKMDQETSEGLIKWGRSGSPLLVDDMVVIPLGGRELSGPPNKRSLIAFDAATGAERWRAGEFQISYASPVVATLAGVRQIVSVNENFVSGHAIDTGETLWFHDWPGPSNSGANCSDPTPIEDKYVLLSKGYGGGALLLELQSGDDGITTEEVWQDNRVLKTKFTNPIAHGDFVYGLSDGSLECVHWLSGESQWKQPRGGRCGQGHITIVEDCIVATSDDGQVILVDLDPENYVELGRFQAIEGKTWNPATVIGNQILLRNTEEMVLWELPAR